MSTANNTKEHSSTKHHSSFSFVRETHLSSLNVTVQEFEHKKTGAQHIHLSADSDENVFLVALRTLPENSKGVAHILEHTALCGSEKYPVRDPFFMMTRRSINTFMNAMTSSDWTAYPFASRNRKDFDNLLDVYLDAVFFSRLDPLDFAQEGHRLEFAEMENSSSELVYKGVVYNEMKGAMSSVNSQLWQARDKYLFPTTTYHHNSGGEPACIPDLSYEELLEFYKTHYHPSNAIFMTYGDISAKEHQLRFDSQALSKFEKLDHKIEVGEEKRYFSPVRVQEGFAYTGDDLASNSHLVIGWLLGNTTDLVEKLRIQLLSSILLGNSASPLQQALETTSLGSAPSSISGFGDHHRHLTFSCGLQGCETGSADAVEALIFDTLKKVASDGVPMGDIESALHQLELSQRELGGGRHPYGLQLIMDSLVCANYDGDPAAPLDIDRALKQLRKDIEDNDFIQKLIQRTLLDNPHFVRLHMTPDPKMGKRKEDSEKELLQKIKDGLSDQQKTAIIEQSKALEARQNQQDDESILPKVTLQDVPKTTKQTVGVTRQTNQYSLTRYDAQTNGIAYQHLVYRTPQLEHQHLDLLNIYCNVLPEMGIGDKSYLEVQRWQARVSGGIHAYSHTRVDVHDTQKLNSFIGVFGKSLNQNHQSMHELMCATVRDVNFTNVARIQELVSQIKSQREQGITQNGHGLAMQAACAGINTVANMNHRLNGLASIKKLTELDSALNNSETLAKLSSDLAQIHKKTCESAPHILVVGEHDKLDKIISHIDSTHLPTINREATPLQALAKTQTIRQAWLTNSQVNFCVKAYPTVSMAHEDAPTLAVLGDVLRNGYLHKHIREQGGAYGSGATQNSVVGAFSFYSYRDPRLEQTLNDFDKSIQWLLAHNDLGQKIEEAILGVISSIDHSESPAERAQNDFSSQLHGRTREIRQTFRERVLNTTQEQLKKVANHYLRPENENLAIVGDYGQQQNAEKLGLEICYIKKPDNHKR